jgi:Tfp pilus assembly protein PilZ
MFESNRRHTQRFDMALPLLVRLENSLSAERDAVSFNISHRGLYFSTDLPVKVGSRMEILLKMPEAIVGRPVREWRCHARVVRVVPLPAPQEAMGVGVEFIYYEVLRNRAPVERKEVPSVSDLGLGTTSLSQGNFR